MTRRTRPPGKPVTPRQPTAPRQPHRPADHSQADSPAKKKPAYVVVVWQAPILRQRNPDLPLSLHEALNLGREPDPEPSLQDREAEQ